MKTCGTMLVVAWMLVSTAISAGSTLSVTPMESLSVVREKLAADATVTEVVFAEDRYRGGLCVDGPEGTDLAQHPLLIRAAEGTHVVFDGARPVEDFGPHEELPGVFWIDYASDGGEYPKSVSRGRVSVTASWPTAWPWHGFQGPIPSKTNTCCPHRRRTVATSRRAAHERARLRHVC